MIFKLLIQQILTNDCNGDNLYTNVHVCMIEKSAAEVWGRRSFIKMAAAIQTAQDRYDIGFQNKEENNMLNFQMYEKVKVVYGQGAIAQIGELAKYMGASKALIVADEGMVRCV